MAVGQIGKLYNYLIQNAANLIKGCCIFLVRRSTRELTGVLLMTNNVKLIGK